MPRSYMEYIFNLNTKNSNVPKQCQPHNHCPENFSALAQHGGFLHLSKRFPDPSYSDVYETSFFNEDDHFELNEQSDTQNPMNTIQSSGLHTQNPMNTIQSSGLQDVASFSVSARAPNNNNSTSFNWKTNKPRSSHKKNYAKVTNRNVITTMNIKDNHQNDRFANIIGCQTPSSQQPLNSSQQSLNSGNQFSNSNLEYTNNQNSLISNEKYLNSIQHVAIIPNKRKQWHNGTLSTHQSKTDVCGQKRSRNELLLEQLLLPSPLYHNILSSLETVDQQPNECGTQRNLLDSQNLTQGLPLTRTYENLTEVEAAVVYPKIDFVKSCNQSMKLPLILPSEQSTDVSCQESQLELLKDISNEYSSDEELSEDTIIIFDQEYNIEMSTSDSLVPDSNKQDLHEDELNSKDFVSREITQLADRLPPLPSFSLSSTETSKSPPQKETKSKKVQFSVNADSKSSDNLEISPHIPFNPENNFVNKADINYVEDKKFSAKECDRLLKSWWTANRESFPVYSNVNNDIQCKVEIVDQNFVPSMTMVTTCNASSTETKGTATLSGDKTVSGTSSLHVGMSIQAPKSEAVVKVRAAEQAAVPKSSSVHETTALLHSMKTVQDMNGSCLKTSVSGNVDVSGRKYVTEPKAALDQTKLLESRIAPDLATVSRDIRPISVDGFINVSKPSTTPKPDSIPSSQVLPRQAIKVTTSVVAPLLVSSFDGSIAASFENPTSKTITPSIHNSQTVPTSTPLELTTVDRAKISSMSMIGSKLENDPLIGAVDTRPTAIKKFTVLVQNKPKPIDKVNRSSTRQNRQCPTFNFTGLGSITPGRSKGMVFENILPITNRSRCQAVQTDIFAAKPTSLARNTAEHDKTMPRLETMPRRKSMDVMASKKSSCQQVTTYSCNLCSYRSNELQNFRRHARQCEAKEGLLPVEVDSLRLRCRRCGYISSGQEDLTNHFIKHQFQKRFLCGYCDQEFDQKVKVVEHILKVHQQSIIFYDREVYGKFSS